MNVYKLLKTKLKNYIHRHEYTQNNITICDRCDISSDVEFEGNNYIGYNSYFRGTIGYASYIGDNSKIRAKIGRYTSIAGGVNVVNGFHPTHKFISTHPSFYSVSNSVALSYCNKNLFDEYRYADPHNKYDIIIGNDVWIGRNVTIMAGITIGDGAIIATGAVVTKNVDPYAIVGGVPAKIIRYRFDEIQRNKLLSLSWWDKDKTWIQQNAELMNDISNIDKLLKR